MMIGNFSFLEFYAHRVRRIFPALFVMLFLTSIGAIFFLGLEEYSDFFSALRKASAQISNFYFAQEIDYFAHGQAESPLLHTWSLGVEEQFYVIWPLILFLGYKFFKSKKIFIFILVLLTVFSLITSEYLLRTNALHAFYMLHSRAWELSLGGLIGLSIFPMIQPKILSNLLVLFGFSLIFLSSLLYVPEGFPGLKALLPVVGACLFIYGSLSKEAIINCVFSVKPLVYIGAISYSLYLWHWPFIAFYKYYFSDELDLNAQIILLALSFLFAITSYHFVEQPFRKMKVRPFIFLTSGIFVIILFIVLSNVVKDYKEASWRVLYEVDQYVMEPHALDKICSVESPGAYDKEQCIIGPKKDSYEVILVGDSHASHYTPLILDWAKNKGYSVRLFMRGACHTWVQTDNQTYRYGKIDQYCMDLRKNFYDILENDNAIKYVFLGIYKPEKLEDVERSFEQITSYDKNVIFLGQTPVFRNDPHNCQIRKNLLISKYFPSKEKRNNIDCFKVEEEFSNNQMDQNMKGVNELISKYNISHFQPALYMDTLIDREGNFIYMDKNHLNRYSVDILQKPFGDFMRQNK